MSDSFAPAAASAALAAPDGPDPLQGGPSGDPSPKPLYTLLRKKEGWYGGERGTGGAQDVGGRKVDWCLARGVKSAMTATSGRGGTQQRVQHCGGSRGTHARWHTSRRALFQLQSPVVLHACRTPQPLPLAACMVRELHGFGACRSFGDGCRG